MSAPRRASARASCINDSSVEGACTRTLANPLTVPGTPGAFKRFGSPQTTATGSPRIVVAAVHANPNKVGPRAAEDLLHECGRDDHPWEHGNPVAGQRRLRASPGQRRWSQHSSTRRTGSVRRVLIRATRRLTRLGNSAATEPPSPCGTCAARFISAPASTHYDADACGVSVAVASSMAVVARPAARTRCRPLHQERRATTVQPSRAQAA